MTTISTRPSQMALLNTVSPIAFLVPPAAVAALLWATSINSVSFVGAACSHVVLQLAWASALLWKKGTHESLPLFATVAGVYWLYFSLALFWGDRSMQAGNHVISVADESVATVMLMVGFSVVCLRLGMLVVPPFASVDRLPDFVDRPTTYVYLKIVLVGGTLLSLGGSSIYLLGAEGRQIMIILSTTVPLAAFAILFRRCLLGTADRLDKPLLGFVTVVRIGSALGSGWLGPVIMFGLTVSVAYVVVRKRIPWMATALTVGALFFFQAGKSAFRDLYWNDAQSLGDSGSGVWERASFWVEQSASQWTDALQSGGQTDSRQLATVSMKRASLLTQVAHVLEVTPSQIPFQDGQTYSYLAVTLVPRLLWPDKPTVSDANRFYQVAYGLSDARTVQATSISVGAMAEAYINFGWPGVLVVMCGIGMLLRAYGNLFLSDAGNVLLLGIGVALFPQWLAIEGQLGQYIAGFCQQVVMIIVIFLPVVRRKSSREVSVQQFAEGFVRVRG